MTEKEILRMLLDEQRETRSAIKDLIISVSAGTTRLDAITKQIDCLLDTVGSHSTTLAAHTTILDRRAAKLGSISRDTLKVIGVIVASAIAACAALVL